MPGAAALAGQSGWYDTEPGGAVFLQWVRVGNNVTGSIQGVVNTGNGVTSATRTFTGVINGNQFILNFTGDTAGETTASGQLVGADIALSYTQRDGTLTSLTLKAGSAVDFNSVAATATRTDTSRKTFDHTKVEAGVTTILTSTPPAGYGITGVTGVSCPADQPVVAGSTFNCTATISGQNKLITITIKDDQGKYEVGVPN